LIKTRLLLHRLIPTENLLRKNLYLKKLKNLQLKKVREKVKKPKKNSMMMATQFLKRSQNQLK
jgi:hypothetical protein